MFLLSELEVHVRGTAVNNTLCKCNESAGYFPVEANKQYGQLNKGDCHLNTTTQIGLCLLCFLLSF